MGEPALEAEARKGSGLKVGKEIEGWRTFHRARSQTVSLRIGVLGSDIGDLTRPEAETWSPISVSAHLNGPP